LFLPGGLLVFVSFLHQPAQTGGMKQRDDLVMQRLLFFLGDCYVVRRGSTFGGEEGREETILFNNCSPDNTYSLIILVELWRVALGIRVTEGREAFCIAEEMVFAARMRASR